MLFRVTRTLIPLFVLTAAGLVPSLPAAPDAPLPDLPPRVVAPTDQTVYRRFVLDNGLRVLLASDPRFNKSAASLVVSVGQIDDPAEFPGLAHFTEHMLFLGTAKYPDVAEYSSYISQHGGYSNAYTSLDHTNYQFEVSHTAFAGALDRFAQFFIAPLFTPEYTGREIFAVHNEAMRHLQNDFRRTLNVRRELYNPDSGESRFSVGNRDTLAGATPEVVRAFYEQHYTSHHMALALTGTASLDEMERLARELFSAIPRRDVAPVQRVQRFLPRQPALRLARIEPVKEVRQLSLEFPIPATRPDFLTKPDALLAALLSYAGDGGLLKTLRDAGLANNAGGYTWERSPDYGSLFIAVDLTPAGEKEIDRVFAMTFSYLEFLRQAPFPHAFYQDRARIAALEETFADRGEGASLATALANQALFYPLEIAERAPYVWGAPDEAAYRRLLAAVTPDNLLATLNAKGVPTDRREKYYDVEYSYEEITGPRYAALLQPTPLAAFRLPGGNPFMPTSTPLFAERALPLIDEPGLHLYYAADTEFKRPQTTLIYRFVPHRALASLESAVLFQFYEAGLNDAIQPALDEAALAGLTSTIKASLDGITINVSGYGDSPDRFARFLAGQLRNFTLTPERFAAVKETIERTLRSYAQTEAFQLARDRSNAFAWEYRYLPDELLERASSVTWPEVQTFIQRTLSRGKIEALAHGHLTPDAAVAGARDFARQLGSGPAPAGELLRPRRMRLAPGDLVIDAGRVEGRNSAFIQDFLFPSDEPAQRAASTVLANFINTPFYSELRTKQQLGYIVGSGAGAVLRERYLTVVIQSSTHDPDDLRQRAEAFLTTLPDQLGAVSEEQFETLIAGARATIDTKPTGIADKAARLFARAYDYDGDWERNQDTLAALDTLTQDQAVALLRAILNPDTARRRLILLSATDHTPSTARPTFTTRGDWKRTQTYE
jgi:insulysin